MFIYFSDQMSKSKSNKSFKSSLCWLFGEILHKWVNRSNIVACPHHHFLLAFNFVHRAPNSVRLRNRNKGTKAPKPFNIYISTKYEGARRSNNCNKSPKYLKQIVHLHFAGQHITCFTLLEQEITLTTFREVLKPFCVELAAHHGFHKRALSWISGNLNHPWTAAYWLWEAEVGQIGLGCHCCLWLFNCRLPDHGQCQGLGRISRFYISGDSPHLRGANWSWKWNLRNHFRIFKVAFPEVTICPPEGSNTALNYDILKIR